MKYVALVTACLFSFISVACGSDDSSGGSSDPALSKLQSCGLLGDDVDEDDSPGDCTADCVAQAECDDLSDLFCDDNFFGEVAQCIQMCTFTCDNGDETVEAFLCDGDDDCSDGSDEADCGETMFTCGDGTEIPLSWECDEDADCDDGSDEADCTEFICD